MAIGKNLYTVALTDSPYPRSWCSLKTIYLGIILLKKLKENRLETPRIDWPTKGTKHFIKRESLRIRNE